MSLTTTTMIITSAFIIFIALYYFLTKREKVLHKKKPSPIDMEMAQELSIDMKFYNKNKVNDINSNDYIRAFISNPKTIFCYWDLANIQEKNLILYCYKNKKKYLEIILNHNSSNYYLSNLEENTNYQFIIATKKNNKVKLLAVSNSITIPPFNLNNKNYLLMKNNYYNDFKKQQNLGYLSNISKYNNKNENN
ncbi:MAG: DUF4912 domain-containing protein [Bacillota bacterium]